MSLSCPSCGGENTQKVSLLFNAGTVNSQSHTTGAMLVGGHIGIASASTHTKNQSALAQQYGPPKPQTGFGCAVFFAAVVIAGISTAVFQYTEVFFSVFAVVMVVGLWKAREVSAELAPKHEKNLVAWYKKFTCLRCGFTFIPSEEAIDGCGQDPSDSTRLWTVMVQSKGPQGLQFMKALRDETGMSLADAMRFVETLPQEVGSRVSLDAAEKLKMKLAASGAVCELFSVAASDQASIEKIEISVADNELNVQRVIPNGDEAKVELAMSQFARPSVESPSDAPILFLITALFIGGSLAVMFVVASSTTPVADRVQTVATLPKPQLHEISQRAVQRSNVHSARDKSHEPVAITALADQTAIARQEPEVEAVQTPLSAREFNPSYSCDAVTGKAELIVCNSEHLSSLDVELFTLYRQALQKSSGSPILVKAQRDWLRFRRNACETEDCLERAYGDRKADLIEWLRADTSGYDHIPRRSTLGQVER